MRRPLKIGLWVLLAVPLAAVLLLLAAVVALNTDPGRRLAERTTARLSGGRVALSGLAGRFPGDLRLAHLALLDDDGTWLQADSLVLQWSPSSLLRSHVSVQQLGAARLDIERRPRTSPGGNAPRRSLPRTLDIARVRVERLELGAELAGTAATLTLQARASLHSLDDSSFELDARRLDGAGRYLAKLDVGAGQVSAALDLAEPEGGALANLLRLPGLGALQANATVAGPQGAEHLHLAATAGALRASADGTLDWAHRGADLAFAAHSTAMSLRPELGWNQLDVDGRWRGSLEDAEATMTATVAGLRGGGASATTLDADVRGRAGRLRVNAKAGGVRIPGAHPDLLAAGPLQMNADVDLHSVPRRATFEVSHPLARGQGSATLQSPTDARVTLRVPALAALAPLTGLALEGSAALRAHVSGDGARGELDADGSIDVSGGAAPLPALAGHDATVVVKLGWNDARLRIDDAHVEGAAARVALSGGRDAKQAWDLKWRATLSDLAALSPALAGDAAGEGTLGGPADDLSASATLRADASIRGSPRGPLQATVNARGLPRRLAADIAMEGTLDAAPLRLSAAVRRDEAGALRLAVPGGDWKSAHVDGELAWPAGTESRRAPRGHLALRVDRLQDLRVITGEEIAGQLAATLEAASDAGGEMAVHATVQNGQFRAFGGDLRMDGHGTTAAMAVEVAAQLRGLPQGELQLSGTANTDFTRQRIAISALHAGYRGQTVQLREPAMLRYGDVLAVEHLRLAMGDAQLDVDARLMPALDLHAALRAVSPASVKPLLEGTSAADAVPAEGRVSGEATLRGSLSQPQGNVQLQASGLRWRRDITEGLPPLEIITSSELHGAEPASVALQVRAGANTSIAAEGQVPLSRDAALALRVEGTADLSLANGFLEAGGRRASGWLTIDGRVAGTPAAPEFRGTAYVNNGDVQDYTTGLHISAITATVEGSRDRLTLAQFSAWAGTGALEGSGSIGLMQAGLPVSLRVTARDAQPISSNLLTARLDADLRLEGMLNGQLRLAGNAQVSRAEITIPNALPVTVATLDVRRPGVTRAPPPPADRPLAIDVTVNAPRAVFVRGRGLDAEVGGDLHWGGTRTAPSISGGFELRTGRFNLAGKSLEFESGRVSFNGQGVANQFDPTLDFVASNTTAGTTATLRVGGYADMPTLTLESTPELPQDEVLSHLLFGATVTQLTALQLAQMGAAVATLGGIGGGGGGPLLAVQRSLGLDRLAISGSGTEGTTGATVEAGRYVSRRVYVGTKQSTTGAAQALVEVDITKGLKLHTTLGTGAGNAQGSTTTDQAGSTVGLAYEFEY